MSIGIDELFEMLLGMNDEATQAKGRELAKDIRCISVFVLPSGAEFGKNIWDNCAKILYKHPDEVLQYHSTQLLEWLSDLNWPGALIILERLLKFTDTRFLASCLSTCVKNTLACDEQKWLSNMSSLLENEKLAADLPKDTYHILHKRYPGPFLEWLTQVNNDDFPWR